MKMQKLALLLITSGFSLSSLFATTWWAKREEKREVEKAKNEVEAAKKEVETAEKRLEKAKEKEDKLEEAEATKAKK